MPGFRYPRSNIRTPSLFGKRSIGTFLLGFLTAVVFLNRGPRTGNIPPEVLQALNNQNSKFQGPQYWKEGFTQKATTLYESKFSRFQLHQVQLEDGKTVIDDWMWYDEGDNINVLVENAIGDYLIFQQTKYGLEGTSYAVVGGLIEPGEKPLHAAQRELKEELGMESLQWKKLGSFRAAANRGGGTTFTFLAKKAHPIDGLEIRSEALLAEGEEEKQQLKELSRKELMTALMEGKFQEIKWTATVALALLSEPQ